VAFDKTVFYLQLVPHGSVATDSAECSVVGTDIMKNGGNAVDAAIAATFCLGVVNPHVTGLGG
jgi:gamma-glutamyltranspeptidase